MTQSVDTGSRPVRVARTAAVTLALALATALPGAQRGGMFQGSADDPAIRYRTADVSNVVADVNRQLEAGTLRLTFEGRSGYLRSALAALDIPVDSQMLVFSPTSLQAKRISAANPRALFFSARAALGWVRDGDVLEVAAHDATLGTVFYTLEQSPAEPPVFKRQTACLGCHAQGATLGVPGLLMFSTRPADEQSFSRSVPMDHRSPLKDRWGGWFVTGSSGAAAHLGNMVPGLDGQDRRRVPSLDGLFEPDGYLSQSSDVAALLVFSHHVHMVNLLTRAGWEARAADPARHGDGRSSPADAEPVAAMLDGVATEVVDYLLFVDEPRLAAPVRGVSGFAERFSSLGPRDRRGRSLFTLDLDERLMTYPLSYVIYSPAFDALPPAIKDPIYRRLWGVLSGAITDDRYRAALPLADRQAVAEILRDTRSDLPPYFQPVTR